MQQLSDSQIKKNKKGFPLVLVIFCLSVLYMGYLRWIGEASAINAVISSILLMLGLSLLRVNVVIALLFSSMFAGVTGGLDFLKTIESFNSGIGEGGRTALSYAMLGAFAAAIAKSGLPTMLSSKITKRLNEVGNDNQTRNIKYFIFSVLFILAFSSQNIIPIHIAFIPITVPPLLLILTKLQIDRRLITCILTFGLVAPYMFFPVGFGAIFLDDILLGNIQQSGLSTDGINASNAMLLPALGMFLGLAFAVLISYRKKRQYDMTKLEAVEASKGTVNYSSKIVALAVFSIVVAFVVQILTHSMIYGGLIGFLLISFTGVLKQADTDDVFIQGMRMMAMIGFIMITAGGFAEVLRETGDIESLVNASSEYMAGNKAVAALLMLLVGLFITIGIGSSFSTIPIIAAIYVPLAVQLGFSPLAIVALVGTAAALGDAGSPSSDSTLGPTSGLNIDGQHNHMWDSVVPTFIHFNLPLLAFGWVAAVTL